MTANPASPEATGRPVEIEEWANRLWVHPTSRVLVDRLATTPMTPNQVSMFSVLAALLAGVCFIELPGVAGALGGLACLFVWHVLDGADGDLARRTGRASPIGELVDGVCDHISQAVIYIALALVLQRAIGPWAWAVATLSGLSHTVQANAYETGRKTYRHWVYGAPWMRQRPDLSRSPAGMANRAYLGAAEIFSPAEDAVEAAMAAQIVRGADAERAARRLYKAKAVGLVKASGILGATGRSLAVVASLLAGSPLWFFLWEITALNAALVWMVIRRRRLNLEIAGLLSGFGAELQAGQAGVEAVSP